MRKLFVACLLIVLAPTSIEAQEFGFGVKASSLGIGVDGAYLLTDRVSVRGGASFIRAGSALNDLLPDEVAGVEATYELPSSSFTLGVDVRVAGQFRVMGGLLFQSDNLMGMGELRDEREIGDGFYGPGGTLEATLEQSSVMPYAGVGFGSVAGEGFGLFLDLAVAFAPGGEVVFGASEELTSIPGFNEDLAKEEAEANDDWGALAHFYPIVQFGVRYGVGR